MTGARGAGTPLPVRTVKAHGEGLTADWHIEIRADFSARLLEDLGSGDPYTILRTADELTVEHNMPDATGAVAASLMDVVPWDEAIKVVTAALGEIGKLPNR